MFCRGDVHIDHRAQKQDLARHHIEQVERHCMRQLVTIEVNNAWPQRTVRSPDDRAGAMRLARIANRIALVGDDPHSWL